MAFSAAVRQGADNPTAAMLLLLDRMVGESRKTSQLLHNQEVVGKQLGDSLIQQGKLLEKQGKALDHVTKKTEQEFRRFDQRYKELEKNSNSRCNTLEVLLQSHLNEHKKQQIEGFKKLQNQIDVLRAAGGINVNNQHVLPQAGTVGGGQTHTRGAYSLGLKNQVNQMIQGIMERDHVPAERAIQHLLTMEEFAGIDRANVRIWWDQKDRIRNYLIMNPGQAKRCRMARHV